MARRKYEYVVIFICVISVGVAITEEADMEIATNSIGFELPPIDLKIQFKDLEAVRRRLDSFVGQLPFHLMDDAKLLVPDIIKKYGYPCESHEVITPDGYILTMHRIPHGRNRHSNLHNPAVFLQHGLMSSSADWLLAGPYKSLGYILADAGYDVWIGNARGNRYSRNHTRSDITVEEFWQFSWHEIALYDVPTMIDYVLETTKEDKLSYIGHSQGTTVFYVLCSEKPVYNDKIKIHISFAPVAYMENVYNPLFRLGSRFKRAFEVMFGFMGLHEFLPDPGLVFGLGANVLCSDSSVTQRLCMNALFSLFGFNEKQMNTTLMPLYMAHAPAGSSIKQFLHYAQTISTGRFGHWDFGPDENIKRYNSEDPPTYELTNIKAPVFLFYSKNDWLSHADDVQHLCEDIKEACAGMVLMEDPKFNHIDYLYAIDAPKLVYEKVLELLEKYNKVV